MDHHLISTDGITAEIRADGAELCSLCDRTGREFLWQAQSPWPRRAPVLFPIVGRLEGDTLHHGGQSYRLLQHGFARDRRFDWLERTPTSCRLLLTDTADTRASYPFAFRFEVGYAVTPDVLTMSFTIANPASVSLPAAMGAHPAFRWPLADGIPKNSHSIIFAAPETAPVRRLKGGLLLPDTQPTPVVGDTLVLSESLFAADALILDQVRSRSLRFTAPNAPTVEIAWQGFQQLGLWMKPGADFLCIEPWCGFADPVGFAGDFAEKPSLLHIPPGGRTGATLHIRLSP